MKTKTFINLTDARTKLPVAICGGAIVGMKTTLENVVIIDCAENNVYTVSEPVAEITEKLENLDWD